MPKIDKRLFGKCAEDLQKNLMDEAEAISGYQEVLNHLCDVRSCDWTFKEYPAPEPDKKGGYHQAAPIDKPTADADRKMFDIIIKEIKAIIADELTHIKTLSTLYEAVTGLKPNDK